MYNLRMKSHCICMEMMQNFITCSIFMFEINNSGAIGCDKLSNVNNALKRLVVAR